MVAVDTEAGNKMTLLDVIGQFLKLGGLPLIVFAALWVGTENAIWALVSLVVTVPLSAVINFYGGIWGKVSPKLQERVAVKIEEKIVQIEEKREEKEEKKQEAMLVDHYYEAYRQYLRDHFRNVDLGGVGIQNEYNIEMERVFVELRVEPKAAHKTEGAVIPREFLQGNRDIWDFWDLPGLSRLVILGYPGSGKTTLLKHMALALIADQERLIKNKKYLPIFIELRHHAKLIIDQPHRSFVDLILNTMKLPPPARWFEEKLRAGGCMIMLDGLDEVGSSEDRKTIIRWFDEQVILPATSQNLFIITSRPLGYRHNPSNKVELVLEVQPFSLAQQEQFIRGWYQADEIKRESGDSSPRVQAQAQNYADRLIAEIRRSEAFSDLAQNPLLVTMLAIVYRQRQKLPENRAALYREICEVFLGKRWESRGIILELRADQAQAVLQPLAYQMMIGGVPELEEEDVLKIIAPPLQEITDTRQADRVFLESFELRTGVLVEHEKGTYRFAHKTFQEFLAAVHIQENQLENDLIGALLANPDLDWWHETAQLYAAQVDASALLKALLKQDSLSPALLSLAIDCERIAKRVKDEKIRPALRHLLKEVVEDHTDPAWNAVATALLRRRLAQAHVMDENTQIVSEAITHADYQLFVDETKANWEYLPLHRFRELIFPERCAREIITGLTPWQATAFCAWLTTRDPLWRYRLPNASEAGHLRQQVTGLTKIMPLLNAEITAPDLTDWNQQVAGYRSFLARALALALDLARARDRDLDLALALALEFASLMRRGLDHPTLSVSAIQYLLFLMQISTAISFNILFIVLHERASQADPQTLLRTFIESQKTLLVESKIDPPQRADLKAVYADWQAHVETIRSMTEGLESILAAWDSGLGTPEALVLVRERKTAG